MIRKLLNLDAYTLIPLGLVVFLLLSFTIPAYNHLNYNANLDYVVKVHNNFKQNTILFNETIFNNSGEGYVNMNGIILAPNKEGFPGGEGKGGTAENSLDCKNIWYSMTDNEIEAEVGSLIKVEDLSEDTEFLITFDENKNLCSYYYVDPNEVNKNNKKGSHIIVYNTLNGDLKLRQNVDIF